MSNAPDHIYLDLSTINNDTTGSSLKTNLEFSETRQQNFIDNPSNYFLSVTRFEVDTPAVSLPIFIPLINNDGRNIDRDETIYTMTMAKPGTGDSTGLLTEGVSLNVKWSPEDKTAELPNNPTANVSKNELQPYTYGTLNNNDNSALTNIYTFTTPKNMSNLAGVLNTSTKPVSLSPNDLVGSSLNSKPSSYTLGWFPGYCIFEYVGADVKLNLYGVTTIGGVFPYDLTGWSLNVQVSLGLTSNYKQNSIIKSVDYSENPAYGDVNVKDMILFLAEDAFNGTDGNFVNTTPFAYDANVIPPIRFVSPTYLPNGTNPLPAIFETATNVTANNYPLTQLTLNNTFQVAVPAVTDGIQTSVEGSWDIMRLNANSDVFSLAVPYPQEFLANFFQGWSLYPTPLANVQRTVGSLNVYDPVACSFTVQSNDVSSFLLTFNSSSFDFNNLNPGMWNGSSIEVATALTPLQILPIILIQFVSYVADVVTLQVYTGLPIVLNTAEAENVTALTFANLQTLWGPPVALVTSSSATVNQFSDIVTNVNLSTLGTYFSTLKYGANYIYQPLYQVFGVSIVNNAPIPNTWTVDFQSQLNMVSNNIITTGQNIQTGYYSCYSARWWLSCLNRTLNDLWVSYGGINTSVNAPFFTIDSNTNLITLLTPFDPNNPVNFAVDEQNATGIGSPYPVYIGSPAGTAPQATNVNYCLFFNEPLMNLLSGFNSVYFGNIFGNATITRCGDAQTLALANTRPYLFNYYVQPINYKGINVCSAQNQTVTPPTKTSFYITTSEYSPVPLWNPIQSLVFTTTLLPVVVSLTTAPLPFNTLTGSGSQSIGANSQISNMLSDIQVGLTSGSEYKPTVLYVPAGEYRLIDLNGSNGIRSASFGVAWKTKYNQVIPFRLGAQCGANLKIMFRRKRFDLGNLAPYDTN